METAQILYDRLTKMWYVCTMEYYSAIKNEILMFAGTWMELQNIMLSKPDPKKQMLYVFSHTCKIAPNTNTSINLHTHTHTHTHTFPIGWLEVSQGGGKEEKNDSK
jgi:hypothetical protein